MIFRVRMPLTHIVDEVATFLPRIGRGSLVRFTNTNESVASPRISGGRECCVYDLDVRIAAQTQQHATRFELSLVVPEECSDARDGRFSNENKPIPRRGRQGA